MKTFTITGDRTEEGLKVHTTQFPHIQMGETTNYETALWVPLAPKEWPVDVPKTVYRCSIKRVKSKVKNRDRPTVLLVPENRRDRESALVLVDIRGERGGEVGMTAARKATQPCPIRGRNVSSGHDECPLCGQLYVGCRHPTSGSFRDYGQFPPHLVQIIKKSYIRYTPDHWKYPGKRKAPWASVLLLAMQPEAVFRVHRFTNEGENETFVKWTGKELLVGSANGIIDTLVAPVHLIA